MNEGRSESANEELRRSLARRQAAGQLASATLDSLTVLLCVLDETGELIYVNQPWRDSATVRGAPLRSVCEVANYLDVCERAVGPDAAEAAVFAAGIRAVLNGEQQALSLAYACHSPADKRWFHGRVKRLPTPGPVRVVVTHEDITERHFAHESLRVSEEKFRGLTTLAPVGIFLTDAAGYCEYANPRWCELAGMSPEAAVGADWFQSVHPEDRLGVASGWERTVASGGQWGQEFRLQAPSGEITWVQSNAAAIRDPAGQVVGYVGINVNISKRKQAEERLQTLHLQLAHLGRLATMVELLAGIAHEVNQPLYSIVNYAKACRNLLMQDAPNLGELREWNQEITIAAARAGAIIQRLRQFVKPSDLQRRPVPIDEVIQESLALVAFETRRLQIAVQQVSEPTQSVVAIDRVQIQQVLVNLLRNSCEALEAKEPGTRDLLVGATRCGSQVEVLVVDNGLGLSNLEVTQIFEPFTTTKPNGLGMGLAISRTIVEAHGGHIWAATNSHGGATFRFTLPAANEGVRQPVGPAAANGSQGEEYSN